MKTKKFKDFKPQNNLLNELYTKFLNINYEDLENYYNKSNGQIGYNVDHLLNLDINDIKNIYQQYSRSDEFESLNDINLYNIYLNDIHYLVNYILHHQNQFGNDKFEKQNKIS